MPSLDFVSNFYQNAYPNQGLQRTQSNTTTVGVVLNVPLFEGFSRTYKIREAQARAEKSEAQWQAAEQQILSDIVQSYADAVSSLANLTFSEKLLQSSQAAVESSIRRYDKGAADILELLSAQSNLIDAEQERIRCIAEWRSARLRLYANAGQLGLLQIASDMNR